MSNLQIAALVYGAIAVFYLTLTYFEGERGGGHWSVHRLAGLVFCLFWPLLTAVFISKLAATPARHKFVFIDHSAPMRRQSAARSPD